MSLYSFKRASLTPRTLYRRRREQASDGLARQMLELHYYSGALYRFIDASLAKPDLLHDFPIGPSSTVVDVGAYVGEWSGPVAVRSGAHVYAFEPGPPFYAKLAGVAARHPNVTAFPYGLGAQTQRARLSLADGPGAAVVAGDAGQGAEIEIRDVVAVFEELGLDAIDLLKVNIEGGEYDLFDRLIETGRLADVDIVLVQFHEWHPHAYGRRRAIRRALRRTHDELWNYPWIFECWRRRSGDRRDGTPPAGH